MRLVTFDAGDGEERFGRVDGDRIVELSGSLLGWLAANGMAEPVPAETGRRHSLADVRLLPPVPRPDKCVCVGVNYAERNEEYRDGSAKPRYPSLFLRVPGSFVGHGQKILRPSVSEQFDYEGEIVLVIGRPGRSIPEAEALAHVAGVTIANEGSVRDWLRHGKFNVTQGKNFESSGSIGPWMVTADTLDLTRPLTLETRVNGEVRQHDSTARLVFSFAFLISYISIFTALRPGDLILTGTPTGAGARFDPPKWLVPGDVVEVEVDGIGVLRNPVADA